MQLSKKKHLKLTQAGFEGYTGPVGVYDFVDGVSVEPLPRHERDRIAATIQSVEIEENGKEMVAGIAERLVEEAANRAVFESETVKQTLEEKIEEEKKLAIGDEVEPKIYTEEEIDAVIDEGGISALRKIGNEWNVKNRSIPALRQMIIDAQEEYLNKRGDQIAEKKRIVEEVVRKTEEASAVAEAATTGNMAAALVDEENAEEISEDAGEDVSDEIAEQES